MKPLNQIPYDNLLCLALRHRWTPTVGSTDILVSGSRCRQWTLHCNDGCDSTAIEWRDMSDNRLPGTYRQYQLTDDYKDSLGYTQSEYLGELRLRVQADLSFRTG